jgi:hypothetical protein
MVTCQLSTLPKYFSNVAHFATSPFGDVASPNGGFFFFFGGGGGGGMRNDCVLLIIKFYSKDFLLI